MAKVENGQFVSVEYRGTLNNGEEFDSNRGKTPMEVHMGAGRMIEGFEHALMGMEEEEEKTFTLAPEQAYGPRDERLMHEMPGEYFPKGETPQVGMMVMLMAPNNHQVPAKVVGVEDDKIILDLNHPLAGEALTFEVKVLGISDTPTQHHGACGSGCSCG